MPLILMIQVFLIHLKGNTGSVFFFCRSLPLISLLIAKSNIEEVKPLKI